MTVRTSWLLDSGQTRQDIRLSPLGTFTPTSPLATRSGVVPGSADGTMRLGGFLASGSGMTVTVLPGRAVVQTSDLQGAYPVALTEPVTLTVPDGNPQPRIDLIVLRVYDNLFDAQGRDEATLELIVGTPASMPQPPATPPGALVLHQITVPAGASAGTGGIPWSTALSGQRTATVAVGGIVPVTTDTSPGSYPGQYRDAGGALQRWDGTTWQPYPPVPAWQNWTPVWTCDNDTVGFGNSSLSCRYVQYGPIVHLVFGIVFGSTANFGASPNVNNNWHFGLPVPAASLMQCIGFAELNDTSSVGHRLHARLRCTTTSAFQLEVDTAEVDSAALLHSGLADSLTPWIWTSGDAIYGTATYEAAV
jgi:hypothetical protein